jgi:hypothetical protein
VSGKIKVSYLCLQGFTYICNLSLNKQKRRLHSIQGIILRDCLAGRGGALPRFLRNASPSSRTALKCPNQQIEIWKLRFAVMLVLLKHKTGSKMAATRSFTAFLAAYKTTRVKHPESNNFHFYSRENLEFNRLRAFNNKHLEKYLNLRQKKWQEHGENCTVSSFMIVHITRYY